MRSGDHLYLDVFELWYRGWTETMVKRFLGKPDRWEPVNHFRNYRGKRTYFLQRVEEAEASAEFEAAFQQSIKRRKIEPDLVEHFLAVRRRRRGQVKRWLKSLTAKDRLVHLVIDEAARSLQEARDRGLQTPHTAGGPTHEGTIARLLGGDS